MASRTHRVITMAKTNTIRMISIAFSRENVLWIFLYVSALFGVESFILAYSRDFYNSETNFNLYMRINLISRFKFFLI